MAENIIYYGPPGTGKTYFMQRLLSDYTDFIISDEQIVQAYTHHSQDWLLITLVVLQNKGKMSPTAIQTKISSFHLQRTINVSATLERHNIEPSTLGVSRALPRVFFEYAHGEWYVDRIRLLQYNLSFFETYLDSVSIEKRYSFVTFHQSFAYEDFIEGIRPTYDASTNSIDYSPKPGIFKLICQAAKTHPEKQYAIFIDEINRGNISEIFGELISLIEIDKRAGQASELSAELPYSKENFVVPNNLNIYGTMNSADKSIATIDIALRRRFQFAPVVPNAEVLKSELEINGIDANNVEGIDLIKLFTTINSRIEVLLDANHLIGHSYFMSVRYADDIIKIMQCKIIPLLAEYFYDDLQKIQLVFNCLDSDGNLRSNAIYCHRELSVDNLFPYIGEYMIDDCKEYYINPHITLNSLRQIYDGVSL